MVGLSPKLRYWLYREPTDMRKGFDGLSGLISSRVVGDPLSGDVYIFVSRARTHVKLLYWDGDGFVLYYKRLERGRFEVPSSIALSHELRRDEVVMLLEGVRVIQSRRQKRYVHGVHSRGSATLEEHSSSADECWLQIAPWQRHCNSSHMRT